MCAFRKGQWIGTCFIQLALSGYEQMKNGTLKILTTVLSILVGSWVGFIIIQDDAEAALVILILYFFVLTLFVVVSVLAFITFKRIRTRSITIQFFISLSMLILVPFIWSGHKRYQIDKERKEAEIEEYQKYLADLEQISRTIHENPDSSLLYVRRSQLKRSQGLWTEALKDSKIAVSKEENLDTYWELGWCHEYLENLTEAKLA